MELRSGTVVSSGTQFTSAEQARAACMGQARVQLPPANRPVFETAVRGVLQRWTALRLAIDNDWAGEQTSDKAAELEASLLGWFYAPGECAGARRAARGVISAVAWVGAERETC